jgi:PAS domain S-box-containing protein
MTVQPIPETLSRVRAFVLLRYTLIIAVAYLLLVQHEFSSLPGGLILLIVVALTSNELITRLPESITDSTAFNATIIISDTVWITGTLLYTGLFTADFFYVYFFVLLLAAIGENLFVIAVATIVACAGYLYILSHTTTSSPVWSSSSLIRLPFLFTAAAFYGYLVDRVRREQQRACAESDTVAHLESEISERKRAKEALRAWVDYAENLINSSLDMIISADVNRNIVEFNKAAEHIFGYTKGEVLGTPINLLYADTSESSLVNDTLLKYDSFTGEVTNKRKNGEIFSSYLSASVIRDAKNSVVGVMGISRDITDSKRAEDALRWLEKAVETMQLGVTITDIHGRIVYTNPADARTHGYRREDLVGEDVRIFAPRELWKPIPLDQVKYIDSWTRESVNIRKDGTVFPVQLTSGSVTNAAGETIGIATICEDISERKRAEEELKTTQLQLIQSEKLESVGRLAAGVAHEVKNPLAIIQQGLAYISDAVSTTDGDTVALVVGKMDNAVRRADRVIKGLLDFSAPKAVDMTPVELKSVVEESLLLVEHQLVTARVTVVKELAENLPPLKLDQHKIEQVFVNLFMNAIQAMPEGGTLTVKAEVQQLTQPGLNVGRRKSDRFRIGDSIVEVHVEDTGSGIPDDKLGRVFDPFFTTKPTGLGTGLGLTVTRKIMELHGATIHIRNRQEGGVRVTLRFKTEGDHGDAKDTAFQNQEMQKT